jgi:hypothetical protein
LAVKPISVLAFSHANVSLDMREIPFSWVKEVRGMAGGGTRRAATWPPPMWVRSF